MSPPMTMDERVEAAAQAAMDEFGRQMGAEPLVARPIGSSDWSAIADPMSVDMRLVVRAALAAAFPELHGDQPKGWIAPWEPTKEMWAAGRVVDGYMLHSVGSVWDAMRDAYLGKGDGG